MAVDLRRYCAETDKAPILAAVRNDPEGLLRLGLTGNDPKLSEDDSWSITVVATVDGRVAGFVTVRATPQFAQGCLQYGYVLPQYRQQGVARRLIRECIRIAVRTWPTANGITGDTIENDPMEALLRSEGFELAGEIRRGWCHGDRAYTKRAWLMYPVVVPSD